MGFGINTTQSQNAGAGGVTNADSAIAGYGKDITRIKIAGDRDGGTIDVGVVKIT